MTRRRLFAVLFAPMLAPFVRRSTAAAFIVALRRDSEKTLMLEEFDRWRMTVRREDDSILGVFRGRIRRLPGKRASRELMEEMKHVEPR